MNTEQLEQFLVVARFLNISRAAEHLYVGHSSLSRHIASLEEDLGVRLLVRDNRSVRLTVAGRLVQEKGPELLEAIRTFRNEIRKAASGVRGSISIVTLGFYYQPIFNWFKTFRSTYPDIDFSVGHDDFGKIYESVLKGTVDIGLTFSYEVEQESPQLETLKLFKEAFCVIVHTEHPLAQKKDVSPKELENERFLGIDDLKVPFVRRFQEQAGIFGCPEKERNQAKSLESLLLQVKAGLGFTVLPRPLAVDFGSGCSILDFKEIDTSFDIIMVWNKSNKNPAIELFQECRTRN